MNLDASKFRLVSTPGSKYAHIPSSFTGENPQWWGPAACNQQLPSYDEYDPTHDRFANGKPPCTRCLQRLRWRVEWLAAFEESYQVLEWAEEET